jgi:hypothetical protein
MRVPKVILRFLLEKRLLENRCVSVVEVEEYLSKLGLRVGSVERYVEILRRRSLIDIASDGNSHVLCAKDDLKTVLLALDND